jgi:hypothetical protein
MIVLVVQVAGDGTALGGWDPEIGATCIQDDLEVLWWRANGDFREVYGSGSALFHYQFRYISVH